jgi:hypothetical protein
MNGFKPMGRILTAICLGAEIFVAGPALAVDAPPAGAPTPDARAAAQAIAQRYGVAGFSQIKELIFTFNVSMGEKKVRRRWSWSPDTDTVVYEGPGPKGEPLAFKYQRAELASADELTRQVDAWFINDKYWLLFPLQLAWDTGVTFEDGGMKKMGVSPGMANELTVRYGPEGGYTPGDVYELFYGPDKMILAWNFKRGGAEKGARPATWEDNRQLGPIVVSTRHRFGETGLLWFTDLSARVAGQDAAVEPKPLPSPQ